MSEWQPIETAPTQKYFEQAHEVLLYGPTLGVKTGRAATYPDGHVYASVSYINGNLAEGGVIGRTATHWMPLPEPPK